ncbi:premnaspirodiene oxygenase-like [Coffea eugenioides]|uniref:premnaspirodiene oxygenase-like n=1 Tax=Coffea eugenioides TaxID=49369 RepID=UPI000F615316|nr:premnaspirodiene oxygenase-like [Coffea eugenioides]
MEMQLPSFALTALFLLLPILLLLVKGTKRSKNSHVSKKMPPGPMQLPFIGNLHQMVGSLPHHTLKKLADKYGPLMHLQLGELSTIIISSPKLAKEVLQSNSLAFANRPQIIVARVMLYNSLGVTFSPYGDYWNQMRQLYIMELLGPKSIESFFRVMEDEISNMVMSIKESEGKPVVVIDEILKYLSSTISRASVGRLCKDQDALILATREAASLAGVFNLADIFPSLKILQLLSGLKPKLDKLCKILDDILDDIISNHEKTKNSTAEEDIVDILLRLKNSNESRFPITNNNIKAIIFELAVAGTITSAVATEWAIAEMLKNPRVMAKAQAEVRQAFERKKNIGVNDVQELKYLKLVIKESLRLHPPGPLLAPRECREECKIGDYIIPSGTVTITNAWAMARDPEYWNDPERFEPERFYNSSIDFRGNDLELIPFGAGKRLCPGINFAVTNIELLLAHLLYHFDWKLPGGISPEDLDMAERFGAAASRKNELRLLPKTYAPSDV